ncbi:MAG TPA: M48 family metalloprotease, partial [Methylophilaceae bacterium]|nr:M48 family metalloprotease [Methylophilaceae bacterium]
MKRILLVLPTLGLALALSVLSGCATTTNSSVAGVDRKQLLILSEAQVQSMSAQSYVQTLKEASSKNNLNTNSAQVTRVRNISNRLIAQTPVFRPDARNWNWEVNVLDTDEINAYCMPGGKIMVYTGL